jgi:predicted choloylglycine hydrolase
MKTLTNTQYMGKKITPGKICFDELGHMYIFVDYCDNCKGKVVLDRKEAELFARKYTYQANKIRTRWLLKQIEKRLA